MNEDNLSLSIRAAQSVSQFTDLEHRYTSSPHAHPRFPTFMGFRARCPLSRCQSILLGELRPSHLVLITLTTTVATVM